MKYYQLLIDTDNNFENYNSVIKFLGLQSTENEKDWVSKGRDSTWKFRVSETEKDPYFDFINNFQNKF